MFSEKLEELSLNFQKDVTYENIKSHKKLGLYSLFFSKNKFLEKPQGQVKLLPSPQQPFKGEDSISIVPLAAHRIEGILFQIVKKVRDSYS